MSATYKSIKTDILRMIATSDLKPDSPLPTRKFFKDKYGVAVATVDRAIQELQREGHLYGVQGKGTFVASRATDNKARKIALLLYDLQYATHPFTGEMIREIGETLQEKGLCLDILATGDVSTFEQEVLDHSRYAGWIIGTHQIDRGIITRMLAENIPFVFAKNYLPGLKVNAVLFNFEKAGMLAAKHLASLGHKKIALLSPKGPAIADEFARGVRTICDKNGIDFPAANIFDVGYGAENISDALPGLLGFTGVIAFGDEIAMEAIRLIQGNGKLVPADISVVGCNDMPLAAFHTPKITTVRLPVRKLGRLAAQRLIDTMEGKAVEDNIILEPELIIRESTKDFVGRRPQNL